jgi:hypothetical protein
MLSGLHRLLLKPFVFKGTLSCRSGCEDGGGSILAHACQPGYTSLREVILHGTERVVLSSLRDVHALASSVRSQLGRPQNLTILPDHQLPWIMHHLRHF